MDKYLEVALDFLKPKPTTSSHLLGFDDGRSRASTVLNLLSLPPQIFRGHRLTSRTAKLLLTAGQDAEQLRRVYAQLVQRTLLLADQVQPYKKCKHLLRFIFSAVLTGTMSIVPNACDETLDALLKVLSLEESINSLQTLLNQGNDNASCHISSAWLLC